MVELGCIDIVTEISLLSSHLAYPCVGHLEVALHVMGYWPFSTQASSWPHAGFGAPTQKAHKHYQTRPSQRREMSQWLVNGIMVLNTMVDILGNSSESSFHGESNIILGIGVLLPYHQEISCWTSEVHRTVRFTDKTLRRTTRTHGKAPDQVSRHPPMRDLQIEEIMGFPVMYRSWTTSLLPIFIFSWSKHAKHS